MKLRSILCISLSILISGCASLTSESVINGHKAKREAILEGDIDSNFQIAIKHFSECYGQSNKGTPIYIAGAGVVNSVPDLNLTVSSGEGYKSILYGNTVKGGTGYFKFSKYEDKTKVLAYSKEWYDMDTELFYKYFNSILKRDVSLCDFWS